MRRLYSKNKTRLCLSCYNCIIKKIVYTIVGFKVKKFSTMKIYKYRPLYDVLFKELFYQELYFASFEELNDPLDLTAGLDFSIEKVEQLEMLLDFLFRTTIDFSGQIGTIENSKNAISAIKNTEKRKELCKKLFEKIIEFQASKKNITINDMVNILGSSWISGKFLWSTDVRSKAQIDNHKKILKKLG